MAITVDWEGLHFEEADLVALDELGRSLPEARLTHFMNAAYYTRAGADAARIEAVFARSIRPSDERGLHVHPWENLVRAAGVEPREEPSFLGEEGLELEGERGFDIELESYAEEEIEAILKKSIELLSLESPKSFRAPFIVGPRIFQSIKRLGFELDSSAIDATWLDELGDGPLVQRVKALWPEVGPDAQPFPIETPLGPILEMPLTGGVVDYVTAEELTLHLTKLIERADREDRVLFAQTGVHQEGGAEYAGRIVEALARVDERARSRLIFDTLSGCAERLRGRTW